MQSDMFPRSMPVDIFSIGCRFSGSYDLVMGIREC